MYLNEKRLEIQTTLNNIKGYVLYDVIPYELGKKEADICIAALKYQLEEMDRNETTV